MLSYYINVEAVFSVGSAKMGGRTAGRGVPPPARAVRRAAGKIGGTCCSTGTVLANTETRYKFLLCYNV